MEHDDNIAGLGKNHDSAAHEHDIAKKQSEAKPAAENLDMEPHSVNKTSEYDIANQSESEENQIAPVHEQADEYAKQEHEKAENWEANKEEE